MYAVMAAVMAVEVGGGGSGGHSVGGLALVTLPCGASLVPRLAGWAGAIWHLRMPHPPTSP